MESKDFESVVRIFKQFNQEQFEIISRIVSMIANESLHHIYTPFDFQMRSLYEFLERDYKSLWKMIKPSEEYLSSREDLERTFHERLHFLYFVNKQEEAKVPSFAVCFMPYEHDTKQSLQPDNPYLINNQSVEQEHEEDGIANLIQGTLNRVDAVRLEMKKDEQEIANIQADTQNLLEKIKAA